MGVIRNILLLSLCVSFFLSLAGVGNSFTYIACTLGGENMTTYFPCTSMGITGNILTSIASLTTVGLGIVAVSVFLFPNPYTIFAGVAFFLLSFFTFPIGIFNEELGIPLIVRGLLGAFYGGIYIFGLLNFIRGTGDT